MKISRTVIIIILSGIYIGLVLSGAFRKLEYLEGDVFIAADRAKKYDALIEQGATAEEAIEIILNSPRSPPPVEVREKIDAWIKRNNLDTVGNPIGTMYTGGTPLFDENTGMSIDRYVYIISNNGHKPWNTEDDAVGDGVDFGRRAPETDFAPSPPLKPRPDNGAVVELVSEEEERLGSLPFSGGSTVPTKPGQNAVLGNPPTDKEMEEILRGLPLLGTYTDKSITRAMDLKKKTQEVFDGNFTEEEKQQALREIHGIPPSGVFGDDEVCAFPKSARVSSGDTPSCNPLGVRDIDSGFIEDPNSEYGCCMPGENWHHRFYAQPIATLDSAPTLNIPGQIEILPDLSAAAAAASRDNIVSARYDEAEEQRVEAMAVAMDMLEGDEPVIQNTPTASPEEVAARYEGAEEEREEALETVMNSIGPSPETTTDEASDTKNMNIGIGISVGVLALFLILFTYYKLRRRY